MAQLQVTVVEARNLKKKDTLSENDPFVQLYLDDKRHSQKTKTKQDAKTPQWNQTFILSVFFLIFFFSRCFSRRFSNHLHGQDTLHVEVYDEDSVRNEKIGSIGINLNDLYEKGSLFSCPRWESCHFSSFPGHLDQWYELSGKFSLRSQGQIHLILDFERLKV